MEGWYCRKEKDIGFRKICILTPNTELCPALHISTPYRRAAVLPKELLVLPVCQTPCSMLFHTLALQTLTPVSPGI
jgi:hypothetical protein